jgi:mRNA interferase RelE/StbE
MNSRMTTLRALRSILTPIYKVVFRPRAKKQFDRLDVALKQQLAKKLKSRTVNPRVAGDRLSGMPDCYKIKLRSSGIRAIYQVRDGALVILVLAVAKREKDEAYRLAAAELANLDD